MPDNIEVILTSLSSSIAANNVNQSGELAADFKSAFESAMQQDTLSQQEIEKLDDYLHQFNNLINQLQNEKKKVASQITQFKRNNAKLSHYNQHK